MINSFIVFFAIVSGTNATSSESGPDSVVESVVNSVPAATDKKTPVMAKLAILIDDMGHSLKSNHALLNLPAELSFAFLPHATYSKALAGTATALNKDILMHAPMEAIYNLPLGPGGMTSQMTEQSFKATLRQNIEAIPNLIGVNNHMGSKLTAMQRQMRWTMEVVKERGLFFLDSKTSAKSVAWQQAKEAGIDCLKRDVFLDHKLTAAAINKQFDRALRIAKLQGHAVVIAHPHALTIKVLKKRLNTLSAQQVQLVSVSTLIAALKEDDAVATQVASRK